MAKTAAQQAASAYEAAVRAKLKAEGQRSNLQRRWGRLIDEIDQEFGGRLFPADGPAGFDEVARRAQEEHATKLLVGLMLRHGPELDKASSRAGYVRAAEEYLAPKAAVKYPLVTGSFPAGLKITRQMAAALKEVGLRENRLHSDETTRIWDGRADPGPARAVIEANGGIVQVRGETAAPVSGVADLKVIGSE